MAGNGDSSESSENGELVCDVSNGECSASLGEDKIAALKEKNREKLALKKLRSFDEELLRLVGQYLGKLGCRYYNFVFNLLFLVLFCVRLSVCQVPLFFLSHSTMKAIIRQSIILVSGRDISVYIE